MNDIAVLENTAVPAALSEAGQVLAMIVHANARGTTPEEMTQLFAMRDRELARIAKRAYVLALSKMSPELPVIEEKGGIKNARGETQSTYAKWADVNEAIKPVLGRHGFTLTFRYAQEPGIIVTTGILSHEEGHSEETSIRLPADVSGSKNAVQAVGSSGSYGKRYTAGALLNLTSRVGSEADDDGVAGAPAFISDEQLSDLRQAMIESKADYGAFMKACKIERETEMPASMFDAAMMKLAQKKAGLR